MARSALFAIKNATGKFFVAGSSTTEDPRTGNILFTPDEVVYELYVEIAQTANTAELPGADLNRRILDCYLVSPTAVDPRILFGTKCLIDLRGGRPIKGKVRNVGYEFGSRGTLGGTLSKVLGDKIMIEEYWES